MRFLGVFVWPRKRDSLRRPTTAFHASSALFRSLRSLFAHWARSLPVRILHFPKIITHASRMRYYFGGERGIRTLAALRTLYSLSRGAPSAVLGYFSMTEQTSSIHF